MADRLCLEGDTMRPCPVAGLRTRIAELESDLSARAHATGTQMDQARAAEAKLHGMTAALRQWRSLAGQMTEERDAAIAQATEAALLRGEVGMLNRENARLRLILSELMDGLDDNIARAHVASFEGRLLLEKEVPGRE